MKTFLNFLASAILSGLATALLRAYDVPWSIWFLVFLSAGLSNSLLTHWSQTIRVPERIVERCLVSLLLPVGLVVLVPLACLVGWCSLQRLGRAFRETGTRLETYNW
jgi:hypothetical protein